MAIHCEAKLNFYYANDPVEHVDTCTLLSTDDGSNHLNGETQHQGSNNNWDGTTAGTTTNWDPPPSTIDPPSDPSTVPSTDPSTDTSADSSTDSSTDSSS
ncbi:MAG: hypothetical protein ABR907_01700 [Terracidiphilus sp.]